MTGPSKFVDLPASSYPFTLRAFDHSGAEVWSETIQGPGALYIPPLARMHGPVSIRVEYADGTVEEEVKP